MKDARDESAGRPAAAGPTTTASHLAALLAAVCPARRIDLAGALSLPVGLPHAGAFRSWLAEERHAGLAYLARDPEARCDPSRHSPWARSLLVFAQRYTAGWSADDSSPQDGAARGRPWTEGVARYARGLDYHDVLLADVRSVLEGLRTAFFGLRARPAVDTGPYLERELAWLAGLGFWGKNTCLIHERLGSGFFLAVAPTNLAITGLAPPGAAAPLFAAAGGERPSSPSPPPASRCGRCTRCLDACPTGALRGPFELDARLCIATWSIEWRGRAPAERRREQGGRLFGCDVCQAVCPWNRWAARHAGGLPPPRSAYGTLPRHAEIGLRELLAIPQADFHRRFRRTPLWRAHPEGMRRNALVVAANTGQREFIGQVHRLAGDDPEKEVRAVAGWAAAKLEREEGR
jgi:epoxyqueuosine reductase